MKPKLLLVIFLAGALMAGFLMLGPSPSASKRTSFSSREIQKKVGFPATRYPGSKPSSLSAGEGGARLSTSDKVRDLIAKIQDALKAADLLDQRLAFGDLLRDLIKEDPRAAARLAGALAVGQEREEMMRRVAQYWTEQDATSARQWAEELTDVGERDAALADVCFQMAQTDPRQATLLADHHGLGDLPGATLENLVMQWALKDLTSATDWAKELPDGDRKDEMLARVAMVMAKTSPAEAAAMVATQLPEGSARTESVISVIHQWAMRDFPGARAWAELFPEGPLRERALGELNGIDQYQRAPSQSTQ